MSESDFAVNPYRSVEVSTSQIALDALPGAIPTGSQHASHPRQLLIRNLMGPNYSISRSKEELNDFVESFIDRMKRNNYYFVKFHEYRWERIPENEWPLYIKNRIRKQRCRINDAKKAIAELQSRQQKQQGVQVASNKRMGVAPVMGPPRRVKKKAARKSVEENKNIPKTYDMPSMCEGDVTEIEIENTGKMLSLIDSFALLGEDKDSRREEFLKGEWFRYKVKNNRDVFNKIHVLHDLPDWEATEYKSADLEILIADIKKGIENNDKFYATILVGGQNYKKEVMAFLKDNIRDDKFQELQKSLDGPRDCKWHNRYSCLFISNGSIIQEYHVDGTGGHLIRLGGEGKATVLFPGLRNQQLDSHADQYRSVKEGKPQIQYKTKRSTNLNRPGDFVFISQEETHGGNR